MIRKNKLKFSISATLLITFIMFIVTLFFGLICTVMYLSTKEETTHVLPSYSDEEIEEDKIIYLGEYYVVPYCGCSECCGTWGINRPVAYDGTEIVYTANQTIAKEGVTIAANPEVFPYGTKLIIDGCEYTVQDNGSNKSTVYLYFESHSDAVEYGMKIKDVYTY